MKISGSDISMVRGDSETIVVSVNNEDGSLRPLKDGDTIYFTVKKDAYTDEKALQKVITNFVDGTALIEIKPRDTRDLRYRPYVYDIQLTEADGTVTTIIPKSTFRVSEEVTHE